MRSQTKVRSGECRGLLFCGAVALLALGCISEAAQLGMPPSSAPAELVEAERLGDLALEAYLKRDVRLQRVSQRLRMAGAELCEGELSPVLGLVVSSPKDVRIGYSLFGRPLPLGFPQALERRFPDGALQVIEVFDGSPASRAGVQRGDILLSVAGSSVRDRFEVDRVGRDSREPVPIELRREGQTLSFTLERVNGCAYPSYLSAADVPNAFAAFELGITAYSSALVRELQTDTQLALVVGHEMGHNIIARRKAAKTSGVRDNEARADYIGAYMTALAGYPLSGSDGELFDVLSRGDPSGIGGRGGPRSHPLNSARTLALKQVVAEIKTKQERQEPLSPDIR